MARRGFVCDVEATSVSLPTTATPATSTSKRETFFKPLQFCPAGGNWTNDSDVECAPEAYFPIAASATMFGDDRKAEPTPKSP